MLLNFPSHGDAKKRCKDTHFFINMQLKFNFNLFLEKPDACNCFAYTKNGAGPVSGAAPLWCSEIFYSACVAVIISDALCAFSRFFLPKPATLSGVRDSTALP